MLVSGTVRIAAFLVSFFVGAFAVWGLSGALLDWVNAPRRPLVLDILPEVRKWRLNMRREFLNERVALVGDSVLLSEWGARSVPAAVRESFRRRGERGPRPAVQALGWPGFHPIAEYCLADEIVSAEPDLIVLEVNLRVFHSGSLGQSGYPELAGHVTLDRFSEAMRLPLSDAGISLDRLFFYRALVASGFEQDWVDVLDRQARILNQRERAEQWIEQATGGKALFERKVSLGAVGYARSLVAGRNRSTKSRLQKNMWPIFEGIEPDHPRLQVLAATLRTFRNASIPVLVWLAPANVQYYQHIGMPVEGLARSAAAVRTVVEGEGAWFADLHWLLPDEAFADSSDHMKMEGPVDGAALLGERLALEIAYALKRTRRPGEAGPFETRRHAVQ